VGHTHDSVPIKIVVVVTKLISPVTPYTPVTTPTSWSAKPSPIDKLTSTFEWRTEGRSELMVAPPDAGSNGGEKRGWHRGLPFYPF
jgi:hypothetical protein